MRILIISPYFPPQAAVASLRAHSFATVWSEAGASVTVLTTVKRADQQGWPMPPGRFRLVEVAHRPPRILEPARRASKDDEARARVDAPPSRIIRRVRRVRDHRGIFASVRMPDLTDFWVRPAVRWAREQSAWDVVFSSGGPYTSHLVALALVRAGRARAWTAEFRDLWVDNHIHRGLFPFTVRERALEQQCLEAADRLVTVSQPLADALERKSGKRVVVAYNGYDGDEIDALPPDRLFEDDGLVRLVFTGTLYETGQDPAPLLRGMAALRARDPAAASRLRLVVAGASHELWKRAAAGHGIPEMIEPRGVVPRPEARRMQRDADALVLVDFEPSVEGALTSKLFEYLSLTPPILVVGGDDETPIARLLAPTGRARHLGRDEARIVDVLHALTEGRPVLDGPANEEAIGMYTRRRQAAGLLEELRGLVGAGEPRVAAAARG